MNPASKIKKHQAGNPENVDVATPGDIYQDLDKEFHFDHDPCPLKHVGISGLLTDWGRSNFVNPPFNDIESWLSKGIQEFNKGKTCVFLITARTNTRYWHKLVFPFASEIRFVEGKVKFEGYKEGYPVPVCIVIYDPRKEEIYLPRDNSLRLGNYRSWTIQP